MHLNHTKLKPFSRSCLQLYHIVRYRIKQANSYSTITKDVSKLTQEVKHTACQAIEQDKTELLKLNQEIWNNPELAFQEYKASKLLSNYLDTKSFQVQEAYHLPTAFRAEYHNQKSNPPINVCVICEYDALPELGHACGHNVIAQIGIGAGIGIKAALEQHPEINGKVTVLGCPAEESGGGKIELIQAQAFDDIDVAMMCHPGYFNAPGTIILAMQEVEVIYEGKASHAAGFPWGGINALDAAVMCYNNISCMRQQLRPEWRVNTIISHGGAKASIIPEEARLVLSLRAPSMGQLAELKRKISGCFEGAAMATGCKVVCKWNPKPYENMLSNRIMEELYTGSVKDLGLLLCEDPTILSKTTGSTDMGNVSHVVPSIHPRFDIKPQDVAHSRLFQVASGSEEAYNAGIIQAKALAMTAIDILLDNTKLETIRDHFETDCKNDLK